MCAHASSATFNSSSSTSAGGLRKKSPSARICGSAKSSMPLSRMHWANSNAAARAVFRCAAAARWSPAPSSSRFGSHCGVLIDIGVIGAGDQAGREQQRNPARTSSRGHTTTVRPTTSTTYRGDPSSIPETPEAISTHQRHHPIRRQRGWLSRSYLPTLASEPTRKDTGLPRRTPPTVGATARRLRRWAGGGRNISQVTSVGRRATSAFVLGQEDPLHHAGCAVNRRHGRRRYRVPSVRVCWARPPGLAKRLGALKGGGCLTV